jgi:hypothetical protein
MGLYATGPILELPGLKTLKVMNTRQKYHRILLDDHTNGDNSLINLRRTAVDRLDYVSGSPVGNEAHTMRMCTCSNHSVVTGGTREQQFDIVNHAWSNLWQMNRRVKLGRPLELLFSVLGVVICVKVTCGAKSTILHVVFGKEVLGARKKFHSSL